MAIIETTQKQINNFLRLQVIAQTIARTNERNSISAVDLMLALITLHKKGLKTEDRSLRVFGCPEALRAWNNSIAKFSKTIGGKFKVLNPARVNEIFAMNEDQLQSEVKKVRQTKTVRSAILNAKFLSTILKKSLNQQASDWPDNFSNSIKSDFPNPIDVYVSLAHFLHEVSINRKKLYPKVPRCVSFKDLASEWLYESIRVSGGEVFYEVGTSLQVALTYIGEKDLILFKSCGDCGFQNLVLINLWMTATQEPPELEKLELCPFRSVLLGWVFCQDRRIDLRGHLTLRNARLEANSRFLSKSIQTLLCLQGHD